MTTALIYGETSRSLPKVRLEATAGLMMGWRVSNMGFFNMVTGSMHNYLLDHGRGPPVLLYTSSTLSACLSFYQSDAVPVEYRPAECSCWRTLRRN